MYTKRSIPFLLVAAILLAPFAVASQEEALPDVILVERAGFFPEGIEYDVGTDTRAPRFLLGSLAEGTIFAVQDDGAYEAFIADEDLMASVGIQIDAEGERLLVCNSDPAAFNPAEAGQALLGIYDLNTGERLHMVNLTELGPEGGRFFCNDVAVDDAGDAYVTNSFAPVIYKVTPDGEASIFAQDDRFTSPFFGLNGIEFHPDGYLLVANAGAQTLFKIPVDDPEALALVELERPLGFDGIILRADGKLVGVSGGTIYALSSDDDWETATIAASAPDHAAATTVTVRGEAVYAIYAHLDQMGSAEPPEAYEIVRIDFEER